MREINVSRAGDPVHAGDKALTWESPTQRGMVNRYATFTIIHTNFNHYLETTQRKQREIIIWRKEIF